MATDCGCHVVSVRVQHGTGCDILEVAHCPLHKAAGKLLDVCHKFIASEGHRVSKICYCGATLPQKCRGSCLTTAARAAIKEAEA